MNTYISLLRGINVSGKKILKMEDLRKLFTKLGAIDVGSYVQSGNVVFRHESGDPGFLAKNIADAIDLDFGFKVPVLVFPVEKLRKIVETNPLAKDVRKETRLLHVTFLGGKPNLQPEESILAKKAGSEEIYIAENVVYLYCPYGYGRTKLNNNFLESKLGVQATTRNWKTTQKLLEMGKEISSNTKEKGSGS